MKEIELYLARLYLRKDGWRLTIIEVYFFESGVNRALIALGWDRAEGIEFGLCS